MSHNHEERDMTDVQFNFHLEKIKEKPSRFILALDAENDFMIQQCKNIPSKSVVMAALHLLLEREAPLWLILKVAFLWKLHHKSK